MKANQKFVQADEAVSPVIGVILMVAITVVLAAVVFVLVSGIGGDGGAAPAMSFTVQQSQSRATVASADSGADWTSMSLTLLSGSGVQYSLNAAANATSDAVDGSQLNATAPAPIRAGDYLSFCGTPPSAEVALIHIDTNTQIRTFQFSALLACAP